MSERMTVEGEALTNEHCGFCGLHYGIHPRYKSLEHLARAVARDREAHEWMPPSTYAAVKQAILDEGLKEYQALLLGIEWQGASVDEPACPRCGGLMPSMTYVYADSAVSMYGVGHRPDCALDAVLAAVRESQDEGGA